MARDLLAPDLAAVVALPPAIGRASSSARRKRAVGDVEAIVIGAGCGGLSAGALLASQGRRVLVLEQSDAVGGCASSFQREGYTFDVGASIFEVLSRSGERWRRWAPP
jgi:cation diffusion facilitator CzcD-associated flavoprotein CzcO